MHKKISQTDQFEQMLQYKPVLGKCIWSSDLSSIQCIAEFQWVLPHCGIMYVHTDRSVRFGFQIVYHSCETENKNLHLKWHVERKYQVEMKQEFAF